MRGDHLWHPQGQHTVAVGGSCSASLAWAAPVSTGVGNPQSAGDQMPENRVQ